MKKLHKLLILIVFFKVLSPLYPLSFSDNLSPRELAALIEQDMSDEQALAQLLMFGWVGAQPSPLIMEWIKTRNIGGVKIFGWNTADTTLLAKSIGELQGASLEGKYKIPLLVATDQEGGLVRHVKGGTSETPGNMAIGASGYPRDAYLSGYYIGRELALLGINMNFAPAVDLFTNRDSILIGPRAFGSDPVRAGILGAAFMKGQLSVGIIPTAKHYPGHGDTDLDSHGILPVLKINFEKLWERELVPYRMLAAEGIPAVMSGHLSFPMTKAGDVPASLSSWFLNDVLRDKIGFKGVVITDDLMMAGATSLLGSVSRTAKQAIMAGNDIIMFSNTPQLYDQVWIFLVSSMKEENDFRRIVRVSTRRVLELKLTNLRGDKAIKYIPDISKLEAELKNPESSAFFSNLASRSVTIVKPEKHDTVFPVKKEDAGRILLAGRFSDFFTYGQIAFPGALTYGYTSETPADEIIYAARNADTIIFCLSDSTDLRFLRRLEQLNKKVIALSVLNPVYLQGVPWVTGAVAIYSYAPESFAAGFSVITGRIPAEGNIPYDWHQ